MNSFLKSGSRPEWLQSSLQSFWTTPTSRSFIKEFTNLLQLKTAVTVYLKSKQLLPFGFAYSFFTTIEDREEEPQCDPFRFGESGIPGATKHSYKLMMQGWNATTTQRTLLTRRSCSVPQMCCLRRHEHFAFGYVRGYVENQSVAPCNNHKTQGQYWLIYATRMQSFREREKGC